MNTNVFMIHYAATNACLFSQYAGFMLKNPVLSYLDANWTGPGLMQLGEGSSVSFVVDNIPYTNEYFLAFRFDPKVRLVSVY